MDNLGITDLYFRFVGFIYMLLEFVNCIIETHVDMTFLPYGLEVCSLTDPGLLLHINYFQYLI